jgi:hypothetical protein
MLYKLSESMLVSSRLIEQAPMEELCQMPGIESVKIVPATGRLTGISELKIAFETTEDGRTAFHAFNTFVVQHLKSRR